MCRRQLVCWSAKGEIKVNEEAAKALCKILEQIAITSITSSQKVVALETLLKKDKKFEAAYKIELAKTQFGSTAPDMKTAIGKLGSELGLR